MTRPIVMHPPFRYPVRLILSALLATSSLHGGMAGPPPRPAQGPQPPQGLESHALAGAPGALDNPLKGLVPFALGSGVDKRRYPYSMEFGYFSLSDLMLDWDRYDWAPFEKFLNQVSADGNQAVTRVTMEYPGQPSGIPKFLLRSGIKIRRTKQWDTASPDYDDPRTIKALCHFIKAWGAKYDGDPRLGFVTLGLVGLWGEWHTWPSPELMPKDASAVQIVDAFGQAFKKTRLLVRYPYVAGGRAVQLNMGFHDDSLAYRDGDPGKLKSVTLPQSMGGWDWSFLQSMLNQGAENRWIECPIGGELRPEIQTVLFTDRERVDDPQDCIQMSHLSWMLDQKGVEGFQAGEAGMDAMVRGMGYDLRVEEAYFNSIQKPGACRVGLRVSNDGVARFYYPWSVTLGIRDSSGKTAREWHTDWDLTQVQPGRIRNFPDWKESGAWRDFGSPHYFETQADLAGLAAGRYTLGLRVLNPLPSPKAKAFRFSNASQEPDGWLPLGSIEVQP
jgi:hypothetical protein